MYQIFLELYDIGHRRTKVARPRTHGFVERFNRTILDEFFRETSRISFICPLKNSRRILMYGLPTTTTNDHTADTATWGGGLLRPSKREKR